MGKSDAEVIALFHEQVNMTPDEIEAWLETPESHKAGTGVGLESGKRIIEILRKNPERKADAYDAEDMQHIRKVVGYNSRHLAQEDHLRKTKTVEELEKTKSTINLRNWGHDPVKVKVQEDDQNASSPTQAGEAEVKGAQGAKRGSEDTSNADVDGVVDDGHSAGEFSADVETGVKRKQSTADQDLSADETEEQGDMDRRSKRMRTSEVPDGPSDD